MKPMVILLAEDNEDDLFFMQRAMRCAAIDSDLQIVRDGQATIDYLAGIGEYADRTRHPPPQLLLLDLKLPLKSGLDVLAWLRQQARWCSLVVIVLSSSREARDIHAAYRLGANAYVVKPNQVSQLNEVLAAIRQFWLQVNQFDSAD